MTSGHSSSHSCFDSGAGLLENSVTNSFLIYHSEGKLVLYSLALMVSNVPGKLKFATILERFLQNRVQVSESIHLSAIK